MSDNIRLIQSAYADSSLLNNSDVANAVEKCIEDLDSGKIRVSEKTVSGWQTNQWVKQAILLYFRLRKIEPIYAGAMCYNDKIPMKSNWQQLNVRVVPPAVARYGVFIDQDAVLMACYINIGAYIGSRSMIDINASIGSCAQIGSDVHVSGNAVIGGVLEPIQANPVIIEDGVFIGAGSSIVEGALVEKEAVIGSHVCITSSTRIIDTTQKNVEYKGYIPERSVVIPGTYAKEFTAGTYNVHCALIIGKRTKQTDSKVSLNETLRQYNIS
jgi:2,3,4,5-tetrahydropyridine-2-carboxylate N-succinyltransferase